MPEWLKLLLLAALFYGGAIWHLWASGTLASFHAEFPIFRFRQRIKPTKQQAGAARPRSKGT